MFLSYSVVARYQETLDVCTCRMFVFVSVVVTVWGSVALLSWIVEVCYMFVQGV